MEGGLFEHYDKQVPVLKQIADYETNIDLATVD